MIHLSNIRPSLITRINSRLLPLYIDCSNKLHPVVTPGRPLPLFSSGPPKLSDSAFATISSEIQCTTVGWALSPLSRRRLIHLNRYSKLLALCLLLDNSLLPLLEKAEKVVPKDVRQNTPIKVGATAGLSSTCRK